MTEVIIVLLVHEFVPDGVGAVLRFVAFERGFAVKFERTILAFKRFISSLKLKMGAYLDIKVEVEVAALAEDLAAVGEGTDEGDFVFSGFVNVEFLD